MKRLKVLLSIFTFAFLLLSLSRPALAQQFTTGKWWAPDLTTFVDKVENSAPENEIFGERYTVAQVYWITGALMHMPLGSLATCIDPAKAGDFDNCFKNTLGLAPGQQRYFAGGSFLGELAVLNDTLLETRPASGVQYIAAQINKYSPVKTAYAQNTPANSGFGFRALAPIQKLWAVSRNLAFGLMAFVIIVLAFMIMLRQKISPQVVITAQSALPKVAIALIVITFSYAIAGLMVDLSYVILGLASAAFSATGTTNLSVIEFFNKLNDPVGGFTGFLAIFLQTMVIGGIIGTLGSFTGVGAIVGGVSIILAFLCLILYIIALFRVFITLLIAYARSVFLVIGFPIIALLSVISVGPGIGGWIRQFASQLAVFVAICLAVATAHLVFWYIGGQQIVQTAVASSNPYEFRVGGLFQDTGNADPSVQFPAFSGFPLALIGIVVGFGVLFSAPKIAKGLSDQIATGKGAYGADTFATMIGAGIPIVGALGTRSFNQATDQAMKGAATAGRSAFDIWRAGINQRRGGGAQTEPGVGASEAPRSKADRG